MRKLFYLMLALPLAFAACDEEPAPTPEPEVKDPVLTLAKDTIDVAAEGGVATVEYTLENAKEGAQFSAECEAEWISNFAYGETITFDVAANDGEAREATVTIKYDVVSKAVTVKQAAKGEEPDPQPEYTMDVEMASAERIADSELPENIFALSFADAESNIRLGIVLAGAEEDTVLQTGEYASNSETLLTEECVLYIWEPAGEYTFVEGYVAVTLEGEVYRFDIELADEEAKLYHFTYEGEVAGMVLSDGPAPEDFNPVKVVAYRDSGWEDGNIELDFYINDTQYHYLDMKDYVNPNTDYLSEGTYKMSDGSISSWSNMVHNLVTGEGADVADAELTITHNDDGTTTLVGFMESEYGVRLNINWTGVVEGFNFDNGGDPENLFVATTMGGREFSPAGESYDTNNFYFFLSDGAESDSDYEAYPGKTFYYFDLYAATDGGENHVIPNGTYTYDPNDTCAAGTTGGYYTYAVVVDETGYDKFRFFDSGTVVVTDGKIEATFSNANGTYNVVYEGDLSFGASSSALSNLESDVVFNETGLTFTAEYYGDYFAENTDNYVFTLIEDYDTYSGKYFTFDMVADYYADDYSGTYTPLTDDADSYVGKFIPGAVQNVYTVGSWYLELENGNVVGAQAPLVDGSIEVIINEDGSRTFVLNCVDDAGNKITGSITGAAQAEVASKSATVTQKTSLKVGAKRNAVR